MGRFGVVFLHSLHGGFLNGLQLFLFRLGGSVLEHHGGKVKLLVAVNIVLLFQQPHGVIGQVYQRALLHLAALGRQAGALLDDGVHRCALHSLRIVGVAVFIVQLQDAQPRRTVPGEIHHGKVCPGDGGVSVHIVEQHPGNAAGKIHKVLIVLQFVFKGRVRQRAALADIVAGQQLFNMVLQVGVLFGGQLHGPAAEHRRIHGGIQNVQNGLMNDDLHCCSSFRDVVFAPSIAQPPEKGESGPGILRILQFTNPAKRAILIISVQKEVELVDEQLEQIEGVVEDIIYENEDNGYVVFEISGGGVLTVVCGIVGELHAGESVICRGRYENHATYGRQFHAQECETDMPKDLEAVYAFLASRSLPYIGARTADKIIDMFGAEALEVIANDPARLTKIPGISPDKADRIQQEFKRMFGMRELIAYLAQFEISPRKAMEVFKAFGVGAMQAIASNPYLLCGEPLQLDFRHADSIAQYYHMEGDCAQRLEAALLRTLRHNAGNGHTCLPRAQLLATASNFIHQPPEKLARALDHCIETEELCVKMFDAVPYIYLPDLLAAEQDIADRLNLLAKRGKNTVRELDKNIQILELTQGFAYAPLQREAIRKAMTENCLVLTGGPGTGKTTTVNAILQLLENQAERVALCAPTGRAAKRLSELTGRKASTIHRLLEVDYTGGVVSFIHNDKNLLKCDVVILDEMSMVDVKLFQALIAALRYTCRIIMVGDADQLPSVGAGNILSEVIRSGCVPTVCLNEIFRQAKRSLIVENAHHIISGEPLQKGSKTDDFFFLETDGEAAQRLVCDLVTTRLPRSYGFDPIRDIQVLCPTKLGPTGTQALNVELQNLLNPPQKGKPQLQSAARVFRVGDKVMQVRNNYEIVWNRIGGEQGVGAYNGDIGIVESINLRERSMVVRMDDRRLLYPAENLNELEIAYAITVHKSQGSEFPAVILPVAQVPPRLCYRNLFYTGVTRARRLCVVAGRRDVVNSMMSNIRQNLRYSGLCALLQAGQPSEQLSTEGESP